MVYMPYCQCLLVHLRNEVLHPHLQSLPFSVYSWCLPLFLQGSGEVLVGCSCCCDGRHVLRVSFISLYTLRDFPFCYMQTSGDICVKLLLCCYLLPLLDTLDSVYLLFPSSVHSWYFFSPIDVSLAEIILILRTLKSCSFEAPMEPHQPNLALSTIQEISSCTTGDTTSFKRYMVFDSIPLHKGQTYQDETVLRIVQLKEYWAHTY